MIEDFLIKFGFEPDVTVVGLVYAMEDRDLLEQRAANVDADTFLSFALFKLAEYPADTLEDFFAAACLCTTSGWVSRTEYLRPAAILIEQGRAPVELSRMMAWAVLRLTQGDKSDGRPPAGALHGLRDLGIAVTGTHGDPRELRRVREHWIG